MVFRDQVQLVLTKDGKQVLTGYSRGAIQLWDVETGRVIRRFEFEPASHATNGAVMIDLPEVEEILARDAAG